MTSALTAERVFRSALAIEGAQTLAQIEAEVRATVLPLGYDRFLLFSASAARDEVVERIYWVEGDWFGDGQSVDAETYIRRCPVMDQWWSQGERVVAHWPVRELNKQHDPAEMIAAIINVIEARNPPYRTVRPASAEEMVRKEQADIWERKASEA